MTTEDRTFDPAEQADPLDRPDTGPAADHDEALPEWLRKATGDDSPPVDAANPAAEPVQQRVSSMGVMLMLLAVGLLVVVGYALYDRSRETPTEGPAPDFAISVWEMDRLALAGQNLDLAALEGQTIVLNFWASWCIPCQQEAPMFERVWQEYADRGVVFLGVNTEDTDSAVFEYIDEFDLTYPHAPDRGGRMEEAYRITGIPETFIINGDGEIMHHFISSPNEADLRAEIDRALNS